jgi:hypothetical protein
VNGDATITGTLYYGTLSAQASDIRLKKDITPLRSSLSNLRKLRGVYYTWDHSHPFSRSFDEHRHIGVLAQEVHAVFPDIVDKVGFTESDGNPGTISSTLNSGEDENVILKVRYVELVPVLIDAIRELEDKVVELQAQRKQSDEKYDRLFEMVAKLTAASPHH